jgi:hypothetical protein
MSNETTARSVAGHVFGADDRCEKCRRNRFACAGDLTNGCCVGLSTWSEREELQAIQDAVWKATVAVASGRGAGAVHAAPDSGDGGAPDWAICVNVGG